MKNRIHRIRDLIENKQWSILREELAVLEPFEVSGIIEELTDDEGVIAFRLLSREQSKETFQHLPIERQESVVEAFAKNVNRLSNLLNDLDPDDRTAFFEELPGQLSQKLIQLLSPEERSIALELLGYPEESIGRLMTPEFIAVRPDFTIQNTLDHIRKYATGSETLNVIYIVDPSWKLLDDITIKEILLAQPEDAISNLMDGKFISLSAFDDQETAVTVFKDSDYSSVPVTDTDGTLLGIVTFDDVMDVEEEETTEDFHKFGAFQDAVINPLKAGVTYMYGKRVLWLSTLVFMNIFSGGPFELRRCNH